LQAEESVKKRGEAVASRGSERQSRGDTLKEGETRELIINERNTYAGSGSLCCWSWSTEFGNGATPDHGGKNEHILRERNNIFNTSSKRQDKRRGGSSSGLGYVDRWETDVRKNP